MKYYVKKTGIQNINEISTISSNTEKKCNICYKKREKRI